MKVTDYQLSHDQICDHLQHHGWLGDDRDVGNVELAVENYQEFHGLVVDANPGPVVQTRIQRTTCGTKEMDIVKARRRGGNGCQWPLDCSEILQYFADFNAIRGITEARADELYGQSVSAWSKVCGIKAERTRNRNASHWTVFVGRSGMSGSTLAWSTLPCGYGCNSNGEMMFNRNETWDDALFLETAIHENGHQFGLDHNQSCSDLMCPYVNGQGSIGQWSIDRMVPKYGDPISLPPPPPSEGNTFTIIGNLYRGEIDLGEYEGEFRPRSVSPL